ncbi:ROK family transcriptional regulator [Herbiconiux sp.]|uniref:ROK family transcriptional regulator n=1 Tax=Herbiconiux sp. TaxID=1871186 RepID=UPI0025BCCC17|nr:ROK family transcriptional regulator [Herbiconiux sp.]
MRTTATADGERTWPELHDGQRAVLLEVLIHGSMSRAELSRRLGLSRTSLSRLTRELVELGLVAEGETLPIGGRGRPSEMLHIRPEAALFAGIKLTGSALYVAVTDLHAKIVLREDHDLDSRAVDDVVALIGDVIRRLRIAHPRLTAVGVCLAGDVEDVGDRQLVVGSHFLGWDQVALADLVGRATGLPAVAANDVQSLTSAHHWFGAGVGLRSFAVIGLGAGIGAGIVANGTIIKGARGHPGKIGHLPVTATGPRCDRGHVGCVSAYVTVPAILQNAQTDEYSEALASARRGEPLALKAFQAAGYALGTAIATIVDLVDPEKVVVTGEGLAILELAWAAMDEGIAARLDPASEPVPVQARDFDFSDYAWAAAISAIRHIV